MHTSQIEPLLERYFDGAATLAEEEALRTFFRGPDVPEHLEPYREIFAWQDEERTVRAGAGVPDLEAVCAAAPALPEAPVVRMWNRPNRFYAIAGIAAGLLLLAGIFTALRWEMTDRANRLAREQEAEVIYNQARGALLILSGNLNHGLAHATPLASFGHAMDQARMLNKFYECETLIINPEVVNASTKH